MPPDVRRWLCPAGRRLIISGYALDPGSARQIYWTKGRTEGTAQKKELLLRRGIATAAHQAAKPKPTSLMIMTFEASCEEAESFIQIHMIRANPRLI